MSESQFARNFTLDPERKQPPTIPEVASYHSPHLMMVQSLPECWQPVSNSIIHLFVDCNQEYDTIPGVKL